MSQDGSWKEHPNVAVIHEFFDAFGAADEARLQAVMTDDFVWHFPGNSPISGDWHGANGLLTGIRAIAMTLGDGHNGFELLDVTANDTCAISVHRDFYQGPDNHFDLRFVIYTRMEDGKMAESWEIPFDAQESDRYFGRQAGIVVRRMSQAERPS